MSVVFKTLIYRVQQFIPHVSTPAADFPSLDRYRPVHTICENTDEVAGLHNLDHAIESTKLKIEKIEASEQFLGTRIRRYRQMLAEHQMRVDKEGNTMSIDDRKRHMEQQENYQQRICDVIDIHKNILTELEILRRKLKDIEKKRIRLMAKKNECTNMSLKATREVDVNDENCQLCDEWNSDVGSLDIEMGVFARIHPSPLQLS